MIMLPSHKRFSLRTERNALPPLKLRVVILLLTVGGHGYSKTAVRVSQDKASEFGVLLKGRIFNMKKAKFSENPGGLTLNWKYQHDLRERFKNK